MMAASEKDPRVVPNAAVPSTAVPSTAVPNAAVPGASRRPYVIAISNQKGGVAKTTTVVSLGGALVRSGKEVLLIDLDPQANLTLALGKDPARVRGAVTEVFFNSATLLSVSRETSIPGLDLVPSNAGMEVAERFLPLRKNYEMILRYAIFAGRPAYPTAPFPQGDVGHSDDNDIPNAAVNPGALDQLPEQPPSAEAVAPAPSFEQGKSEQSKGEQSSPLPGSRLDITNADILAARTMASDSVALAAPPYDFIIIDCPPFIGAVTINAITAADMLIIPTQPEYFSAHALRTMMAAVKQVRSQNNPWLVYRILITMLDRRNRIHRQVSEQIRAAFGGFSGSAGEGEPATRSIMRAVFETAIEVDTKLRESAVEGLPITHWRVRPEAVSSHAADGSLVYGPARSAARSAAQYEALAQELIHYVESTRSL